MFVGTSRGVEARVVPQRGYPIRFVHARGLSRRPLQLARALAETALGLVESLGVLWRFRPDLVVGTGGYVSAPAVVAAAVLRVPVVLLEQNAVPGKTTRLLARLARKVCLSFPGSRQYLVGRPVEVTGNPVRPELLVASREQAQRELGVESTRPCLLVTGASQGASSLNQAVLEALPLWKNKDWTILHLTGPASFAEVESQARAALGDGKLAYLAFGYLERMELAYACADLVVSRAGATTIAELTCLGLPAILVPYPFAEGHQESNAVPVETAGGGVIVRDAEVVQRLAPVVEELMEDRRRLVAMGEASRELGAPGALDRIARICKEVSSEAH